MCVSDNKGKATMKVKFFWNTQEDDAPMIVTDHKGNETIIPFDDAPRIVRDIAVAKGWNFMDTIHEFTTNREVTVTIEKRKP